VTRPSEAVGIAAQAAGTTAEVEGPAADGGRSVAPRPRAPGGPRPRLKADERRDQLLDVAAAILVTDGAAGLSMERLATGAGVSKALPYRHFDNREAVLVALYRRETGALGQAVWDALSAAGPGDDLIAASIHAYFDEMDRRAAILTALAAPGSTVAAVADPGSAGVPFVVEVFERFHGLDHDRAKVVAGMVQGALVGGAATWLAGHARRDDVEAELIAMFHAVVAPVGRFSARGGTAEAARRARGRRPG
jgi:AcrR family transcriptional regulator